MIVRFHQIYKKVLADTNINVTMLILQSKVNLNKKNYRFSIKNKEAIVRISIFVFYLFLFYEL